MKIRALKSFEGIRDVERNVYPKEGDVWEVNQERADFLKSHGVIEFVEEEKVEEIVEEVKEDKVEELNEEIQEHIEVKPNKKKKNSKK